VPPLLHFASYREIAEEIAVRLAASSSGEVIVSSYGLATTATAELLRRSKIAAVSVRLSLLDTFARRVVNDAGEYPREAAEAERHLAMRAAVKAIDDPMMETRGIVAMMERSYRDVRDGGMTLAEFERRSRSKTLRSRQRTQMILGIWREYEKLIAHLQAVDPADILDRAAVLIESGKVSVPAQVIAGFYDMTGAQLRILHALKKTGKVSAIFVPAGEDAAYAFASRFVGSVGAMADRLKPVLHIKKPEATVAQCGNKEMELRAVCHSIRELLDSGVPADRIGITTRALDRAAYLRLLLVAEGEQSRGVGAALLRDAERRARASGCRHLVLLVTSANRRARTFYTRHGYRHVGNLPGFVRPAIGESLYVKTWPTRRTRALAASFDRLATPGLA